MTEGETELKAEAYGPEGDPSKHLSLADLNAGLESLATPPRDRGTLTLIVRRLPNGERETPESARLTLEEGVPGDGWNRRPPRDPGAQTTVIRMDIAELIAAGQPLTHFGDNLFVDLDITAASLPPGSRVRVGEALVEVTPLPHNGCRKFKGRFGQDALVFVSAPATRPENRRGIHWRIIEAGEVAVGSPVEVVSRP
ncbi:MAG TPA: MOSC domain-containing protein [Myxococcales bacterium]|nr:MOSC domain-containing protein [Myxococcales bacterium]HIL79958.1 MOSC domain-containing protein [Myxococcales bacterium]